MRILSELSPMRAGISIAMLALFVYAGCSQDQRITPDSTPPAAITDLTIFSVGDSSIALTWTAPGNDGHEGRASEYDLRRSAEIIPDSTFHAATQIDDLPSPSESGQADTFTVEGLEPYTRYYFAIKTADGRPNWSDMSNVVMDTTEIGNLDIYPPGDVVDLFVAAITNSSVTLTWTAPGDDGDQGQADAYDLRYAFTEGNDSTWWAEATTVPSPPTPEEPSAAGTVEEVFIEGLLADTTYYFALIVSDERPNDSALSNVAAATTPADTVAPSVPFALEIIAKTDSSITLTWIAPGDDGDTGRAEIYDIRYSTSPGGDLAWFAAADTVTGEPPPTPAGAMETFTVNGLEAATYYYVGLRAGDEVPNWSAISDVVADSTAAAPDSIPPGAVEEFALAAVTSSSLTITWIAPGLEDGSVYAIEYDVRYTTGVLDDETWDDATSVTQLALPASPGDPEELTIEELQANRLYSVALRWADQDTAWSELSTVVRAVTPLEEVLSVSAVRVPAGSFDMGDGASFCGNEEHAVTLTRAFELGQYEITNQEYADLLQWAYNHDYVRADGSSVWDNLDGGTSELLDLDAAGCEIAFADGVFSLRNAGQGENPDHPVKEVTWFGAAAFCDWFNLYEGLARSYDHSDWSLEAGPPYEAGGYRLPTDAEWEYAARYDDDRVYPWGNEDPDCTLANYWECGLDWSTPAGSYPGAPTIDESALYDLAGNVWEWCQDWFTCSLGTDPVTNPPGPASGTERLLRGSSWYLVGPHRMRCAYRGQSHDPHFSSERIGFRVARSAAP